MAWNDDKGGKDPWSDRNQSSPPDLSELLSKWFKGKKTAPAGGAPGGDSVAIKVVAVLVIVVLVALWGFAGIFVVPPTDQAVVLRFGRLVETLGPGVHWIPSIVESKYMVNVQRISTFDYQADMLTQDENIVSVTIAVQYRIGKPGEFLFNVVQPITTLKEATSSALRQVVGETTLDEILTKGREKVREEVETQLKQVLTSYKTGIEVTDVNLQPAKPPTEVTAAFDDAIKAREDEQRYINRAEAYAQQVESTVKGRVARLQQEAHAYKEKIVLEAKGRTARFSALLTPYRQAPEVMRSRMYFDTMSQVLSQTTNVVDESEGKSILYLPVDKWQHSKEGSDTDADTGSDTTSASSSKSDTDSDRSQPVVSALSGSGGFFGDVPSNPYGGSN